MQHGHSISDLRSSVSQKRGTGEWRIKAFPFGIAMILSRAETAALRKQGFNSQAELVRGIWGQEIIGASLNQYRMLPTLEGADTIPQITGYGS
jgi:hypothetical protein